MHTRMHARMRACTTIILLSPCYWYSSQLWPSCTSSSDHGLLSAPAHNGTLSPIVPLCLSSLLSICTRAHITAPSSAVFRQKYSESIQKYRPAVRTKMERDIHMFRAAATLSMENAVVKSDQSQLFPKMFYLNMWFMCKWEEIYPPCLLGFPINLLLKSININFSALLKVSWALLINT